MCEVFTCDKCNGQGIVTIKTYESKATTKLKIFKKIETASDLSTCKKCGGAGSLDWIDNARGGVATWLLSGWTVYARKADIGYNAIEAIEVGLKFIVKGFRSMKKVIIIK